MPETESEAFRRHAAGRQRGALAELARFVLRNKRWWLTPIIVVLLLLGLLVLLGGSGVAPFIYTLF